MEMRLNPPPEPPHPTVMKVTSATARTEVLRLYISRRKCKTKARRATCTFALSMYDQKIIDALIARAAEDARAFRTQHPQDVPSDRWIENSFTAALPLA